MRREIYVNQTLGQMPHHLSQQWRSWLDQHQLDPCRIPLGAMISTDDDRRTITTTYYTLDDRNRLVHDEYDQPITTTITRNLETPALPIPDGLTSWAAE